MSTERGPSTFSTYGRRGSVAGNVRGGARVIETYSLPRPPSTTTGPRPALVDEVAEQAGTGLINLTGMRPDSEAIVLMLSRLDRAIPSDT